MLGRTGCPLLSPCKPPPQPHEQQRYAKANQEWNRIEDSPLHAPPRLRVRNLLLPFGTRPEQLAIPGYWQTILPGSQASAVRRIPDSSGKSPCDRVVMTFGIVAGTGA